MFLDRLHAIDGAIKNRRCKHLLFNKIGHHVRLVFDELRKMLVIVSSDKASNAISSSLKLTIFAQLLMHVYEFDDTLCFRAVGSSIPLKSWYPIEGTSIQNACSVTGTEDILLVDSQAHARIFSLVTQRFRLVHPFLCGCLCSKLEQTCNTGASSNSFQRPLHTRRIMLVSLL